MKVNFNLKSPGAKFSVIQLKFSYNRRQFRISTGLKVDPERWNKETHRMRGRSKDANELNEKLRLIEDGLMKLFNGIRYEELRPFDEIKLRAEQVIGQAINGFYSSQRSNEIPPFLRQDAYKGVNNINDAIHMFLEKKKLTLSYGRQRHYRSLKNILNQYNLGYTNIHLWDVYHFEKLRDAMIEDGKRNDTILAKIKMIKAVLRDINANHPSLKFKFTTNVKHHQPILTEEELDHLRAAVIPPGFDRTRDLFLFQCNTGQRISDLHNLTKSRITNNIWSFSQRKTTSNVMVPLNSEAIEILEKYDYNLPVLSDQYHNRNLKEMARFAKLNRVIHIERRSGNNLIHIEEPVHRLISSHMARRIFITHNLNAGRPIHLIAKVTGQSLATLQKYEQAGEEALRNFWK